MLAVAHIVGAVIAVVAFATVVVLLAEWESTRNLRSAVEEISVALGIPVERLDDEENSSRIVQYAAARFSSDRFQNRLSDLWWWMLSAWGWFGGLLQVAILIGVVWYTVTDSPSNAVYAWSLLAISVVVWLVGLVSALVCRFLTGRFPGEARQVRKSLAEFLKNSEKTRSLIPKTIRPFS